MSVQDALILGAIQGLTEFLPVSSSGHLVLAEAVMKLPVENLKSFDIATHFGTLLALLLYFWKDFLGIIGGFFRTVRRGYWWFQAAVWPHQAFKTEKDFQHHTHEEQLFRWLVVATLPAILLGLTLGDWLDAMFRHPGSVAIFMIVVGVLFFIAELVYSKVKTRNVGFREGVVMGLAQCIALIPGVSRSGITISSGLFQGVKREEAAKFSFLLGSIAILGGTVFAVVAVLKGKYAMPPVDALVAGIFSSFIVGLGAISFLMKFLKKHTLHVFGVYRVILGFVLLYLVNFTGIFG